MGIAIVIVAVVSMIAAVALERSSRPRVPSPRDRYAVDPRSLRPLRLPSV